MGYMFLTHDDDFLCLQLHRVQCTLLKSTIIQLQNQHDPLCGACLTQDYGVMSQMSFLNITNSQSCNLSREEHIPEKCAKQSRQEKISHPRLHLYLYIFQVKKRSA
jgi:hypothetical protein